MPGDFTLEQLVQELADGTGPDLRGYKHTTLERARSASYLTPFSSI
jgi:hypothetical protein